MMVRDIRILLFIVVYLGLCLLCYCTSGVVTIQMR